MGAQGIIDNESGYQAEVNEARQLSVTNSSSPVEPYYVFAGAFNPPTNTDAMAASYPTSTEEIYQFYNGGLEGTLLATITVTYTDATKLEIQSVVRT
jgi:hypothetical protein